MAGFLFSLVCVLAACWLVAGTGAAAVGGFMAGLGWATVFAAGSIGFWLLMLGTCAALCFADEKESGSGATAVVLVTLILLSVCGDFRPWPWLAANWWKAAIGFVLYFAFGGGAWAVFMLRRRAKAELAKYEKAFDLYLINCQARTEEDLTAEQRLQWQEHRRKGKYVHDFATEKKVAELKGTIIYWICYWPTSLLWFLIRDLVKEIAEEIFRRMQGFYQWVWDGVWKGARGNF